MSWLSPDPLLLSAELSKRKPLAQAAPPLFQQPPKKRQRLSSPQDDSRPLHHRSNRYTSPDLPVDDSLQPLLSAVKTEISSEGSPELHESPLNSSDLGSEAAHSAAAKETPGSSASWQPTPHGGHNTPPLLFPSSSGQDQQTTLGPQAMDCDPPLTSASKGSSNAVTPVEHDPQGLQPRPLSDPPSGASTAGHSVIDTVVGPSPFDPSDSIKRQLLAAVGGHLDVASLEGLVKPLFASPPGSEQGDLHSLLFAAQHQLSGHQSQPAQQNSQRHQTYHSASPGTGAVHPHFPSDPAVKADATANHLSVPALKLQANPIAKPHAMPRTVDTKPSTAASGDQSHGHDHATGHAPASDAQPQQLELHRAASAHMATMLQIPFSGLSRMQLWQPPPLQLDSPPLTLSPHSPLTSLAPVITPVTLASICNLTRKHQQQPLPSGGHARPAVLSQPSALQNAHEGTGDDTSLDLESLMRAVRAEGAALYAAATALGKAYTGAPRLSRAISLHPVPEASNEKTCRDSSQTCSSGNLCKIAQTRMFFYFDNIRSIQVASQLRLCTF